MRKQDAAKDPQSSLLIGWREWCALPQLSIPVIKAKIDTGARTSAIHAYNIEPVTSQGEDWVKFQLHPIQANDQVVIPCLAPIADTRDVMSSNGEKEHRFVIKTELQLGPRCWEIELTLSNRDPLRFRLLLGRSALKENVLIDPAHSYNVTKYTQEQQRQLYHSTGRKQS
jgi:ribosomal protein S6--L-glutamate ligase